MWGEVSLMIVVYLVTYDWHYNVAACFLISFWCQTPFIVWSPREAAP